MHTYICLYICIDSHVHIHIHIPFDIYIYVCTYRKGGRGGESCTHRPPPPPSAPGEDAPGFFRVRAVFYGLFVVWVLKQVVYHKLEYMVYI